MTDSILSREPNVMGAYFGHAPADSRLISVWLDRYTLGWRSSVAGEGIMLGRAPGFSSKRAAEAAALEWIKENPVKDEEGAS